MIAPGEMTVLGTFPAKVLKALAAIDDTLHSEFDRQQWIAAPGKSKESCVLACLTARDFLVSVGFRDATVRSVACIMGAWQAGQVLHTLGIGAPPAAGHVEVLENRWNGHLVVIVPSVHLLIDLTLYGAIRPAWRGNLTGMLAVPYGTPAPALMFGRRPFACAEVEEGDYRFSVIWLDRPENRSWKNGPDAVERWRRKAVAHALRLRFGSLR